MAAYYNEFDPFAAAWLRELIREGLIADGEVDTRSVVDVAGEDLRGFTQVHLFAGIGGWSYALRLAGWPDDRPVWTGSCPCQPFSAAGRQRGFYDPRHLWPQFKRLIGERRPPVVFGEQVAAAVDWLRLVRSDLEALDYAVGAVPVQAASAGAYHLRDRWWFVADAHQLGTSQGREQRSGEQRGLGDYSESCTVVNNTCDGRSEGRPEHELRSGRGSAASTSQWIIGADGKARRVEPGIHLLAHGIPGRVGKLRGFGNAIDPRPAAAFIKAYLEATAS